MTNMVDGAYGSEHAVIPESLAVRKLSPETVLALRKLLVSDVMRGESTDDRFRPSVAYTHWIRAVLHEPKAIAAIAVERLLYHHASGLVRLSYPEDLQFIVGLMQFDTHWGSVTTLSRRQETAAIMLEQALAMASGVGISYGNAYGNNLQGTRTLFLSLCEYVLNNPDRIDDVCFLIRERGVRNLRVMKPLLKAMETRALSAGVL